MLIEASLFDAETESYEFDRSLIDQIALPVNDRYGDALFPGYFYQYAGMARKYKPKRIYEVGARYGYIAIAMVAGVRANRGRPNTEYVGIDDESYHHGSCAQANRNFAQVFPDVKMRAMYWNSFHGMPPDLGSFDFIHIDGNHDYHGVMNDAMACWPWLNPGGIMLFDDATVDSPIWEAIQNFTAQFHSSPESVEYHYQRNERNHVYLRKAP